ncbi:hypothetical protein TIFTF001_017291 [Ficus carica]|uniref:Uncharacterized protein n=1 Tax=Ficus carica TaxID=3494 RepID=A0AA88DJ03_FICCA|nr:hypothetical protein TIFTF001_017291 [Ficus carica]
MSSEGKKGSLSVMVTVFEMKPEIAIVELLNPTVTTAVFEVKPEVAVVDFSNSAHDTVEYAKFCV